MYFPPFSFVRATASVSSVQYVAGCVCRSGPVGPGTVCCSQEGVGHALYRDGRTITRRGRGGRGKLRQIKLPAEQIMVTPEESNKINLSRHFSNMDGQLGI